MRSPSLHQRSMYSLSANGIINKHLWRRVFFQLLFLKISNMTRVEKAFFSSRVFCIFFLAGVFGLLARYVICSVYSSLLNFISTFFQFLLQWFFISGANGIYKEEIMVSTHLIDPWMVISGVTPHNVNVFIKHVSCVGIGLQR